MLRPPPRRAGQTASWTRVALVRADRAIHAVRTRARATRAALGRGIHAVPWLRVAGLGAIDGAAWTHSTAVGLLVAGAALLILEWSVTER